jgi:hypothetical protein
MPIVPFIIDVCSCPRRAASIILKMTRIVTHLTVVVLAVATLAAGGCSKAKEDRPVKEAVLPLLQREAQSLKTDGEKVDPKLGVQATWNIVSVEVKEQAPGSDSPWAGTIRFKIDSTMKEVDGTPVTQSFEKRFEYVWNSTLNRWIIQYTPPAPAKR